MKLFSDSFIISQRRLAAVLLLVSSTLAWFFLFNFYITEIFQSLAPSGSSWITIGQVLFYSFAVFWTVVGSLIGGKVDRRKLLLLWISVGVIATASIAFFQGPAFLIISSSLLGFSLGLGLPSSLALIADWTNVGERARVSGIIILVTFLIVFLTIAVVEVFGLGILGKILFIAVVKSIGLLALILDRCDKKKESQEARIQSKVYRNFFFYLFPWVMLNLAAGLAINLIPSTSSYEWAHSIGSILRIACMAVFGFAAGFTADRFGRKQHLIIGLLSLGAGFALIGFAMNEISAVIFYAIGGVAWGLFFVVFLSVPGDLSTSNSREKYYALGTVLPLVVLLGISSVPIHTLLSIFPTSSFSQILSLILFLSISPILLAKETLPESQIRARRLKEYIERGRKLMQKSKKQK